MKIIFLSMLLSFALFGDYIRWQSDYEKALVAAKEQNRDILLLIFGENSKNSKAILTDFFAREEIVRVVNEKYMPVVAFFEDKNSYPIELFYTQSFPALFLVSSKDESFLHEPIFKDFGLSSAK